MQQNDPLLKQGALDKHEDNGDHATIFTLIHHSLESECVLSYGGVKYVIKNNPWRKWAFTSNQP